MKKMNRFLRLATIGSIALAISLSACRKKKSDEVVEPDPDLTTERDISNADNDQNSILKDIDKALDNAGASLRQEEVSYFTTFERTDSTATIEGVEYTRFMQLTYTGTADDMQSRSGIVKIFSKGKRTTNDFVAHVTFSGVRVGGRSITGTKKIEQIKADGSNEWKFNVKVSGTVTTIENKTVTYTSNRTRVRKGINTLLDLTDDSFSITGSWTGTNGSGESVSANISSPLQLAYDCSRFREITAGKIDFTNNSRGITRSVDYGSGACDGLATFINSKGRAFTFAFKR